MYNIQVDDFNKQNILNYVSQEEVFERYGIPVEYDTLFCNPLREDTNPTCSFKWRNGKLYLRDWIDPIGKDCFDIVKELHKVNFQEAIDIVATEFDLKNGEKKERKPTLLIRPQKDAAKLEIASQNYTKYCIAYWDSQRISMPTLLHFDVVSVRALWIRGNKVYDWNKNDLCFAYKFTDTIIKVYFPMRKKGQIRFFNTDNTVLEGFSKLPKSDDICIVTKSYKDVMSLYEFDIPAVAGACESYTISPLVASILRDRFPNLATLMDNDMTGKKAAIRYYNIHQLPALLFPYDKPKDFTANRMKYGDSYMRDLITKVKEQYEIVERGNYTDAQIRKNI